MAVNIIFRGTERSQTETSDLRVFKTHNNEIFIEVHEDERSPSWICLDKETAIRFHKELKKQISYLESEVDNV